MEKPMPAVPPAPEPKRELAEEQPQPSPEEAQDDNAASEAERFRESQERLEDLKIQAKDNKLVQSALELFSGRIADIHG
jgi:hypothetical protein